jgi:hypothetical protein
MKKVTSTDLISDIVKKGIITEKEINLICRRVNAGEKINLSGIWDGEIEITPEQTKKELDWLNNQWKSPSGKERKNNPFRYREQEVLKTFNRFYFSGIYDCGNSYHSFYIPVYIVCGKNGSFEYYVSGGVCHIIG